MQFIFSCKKEVGFGKALYLTGDIEALGGWCPQKAIKMRWEQGEQWKTNVEIWNKKQRFQYKYFISNYDYIEQIEWETGPNRLFKPGHHEEKLEELKDTWETRNVKLVFFSSFFSSQSANAQISKMYVQGNKKNGKHKYFIGSPFSLGQFSRFMEMQRYKQFQSMVGITFQIDFQIDVHVDCFFYYRFQFESGDKVVQSSLYQMNLDDINYNQQYKNIILMKHGEVFGNDLTISKINDRLYYGQIPKNCRDITKIKRLNIDTIIKFIPDTEANSPVYIESEAKFIEYQVNIDLSRKEKTIEEIVNFLNNQQENSKVQKYYYDEFFRIYIFAVDSIHILRNIFHSQHQLQVNLVTTHENRY